MLAAFLRTAGLALAIVLLGGLAYWQLAAPSAGKPPLNSRQEDVVRANIGADSLAAARYLARAARTDSAAQKAYVSGQAITRMAQQYHRLTHAKHAPLPATPSAAALDSLQRLLATY